MRKARELGLADPVLDRARRLVVVVVASIGPVCTDALRRHGLPVDLEPEHPNGTPSRGRRATPTRAARSQARRLATAIR
jgi:hypothetical protein